MTFVTRVGPTDAPVPAGDEGATLVRHMALTSSASASSRSHELQWIADAGRERCRAGYPVRFPTCAASIGAQVIAGHPARGMRVPRHAHGDRSACNPSVSALNGISDDRIEKLVAFAGAPGLRISA